MKPNFASSNQDGNGRESSEAQVGEYASEAATRVCNDSTRKQTGIKFMTFSAPEIFAIRFGGKHPNQDISV